MMRVTPLYCFDYFVVVVAVIVIVTIIIIIILVVIGQCSITPVRGVYEVQRL